MNRREIVAGAVMLAVGVFIGVRVSLSLWQVTIGLFYAAPFFNPMSLLNGLLITWVMSAVGSAMIVDGLRRLPRLPMISALTQMPEN